MKDKKNQPMESFPNGEAEAIVSNDLQLTKAHGILSMW
jgi:hypothetical protein